jgi:hypothetical protein
LSNQKEILGKFVGGLGGFFNFAFSQILHILSNQKEILGKFVGGLGGFLKS